MRTAKLIRATPSERKFNANADLNIFTKIHSKFEGFWEAKRYVTHSIVAGERNREQKKTPVETPAFF
jgi:hypothetical protein